MENFKKLHGKFKKKIEKFYGKFKKIIQKIFLKIINFEKNEKI